MAKWCAHTKTLIMKFMSDSFNPTSSLQNEGAKYFIRLTEDQMILLRRNDPDAQDVVLKWIYGYFDAFVRHISHKFGERISLEECEDLVADFLATRFRTLVRAYACQSAERFSGALVTSLINFSQDYLRSVTVKHPTCDGGEARIRRNVSMYEPKGANGEDSRTIEDVLPELQTVAVQAMSGLCGLDRDRFRDEIAAYIARFCKGDLVREWVLRAFCLDEMDIEEILAELPQKFPGKKYAANSVYSLWFRFRHDAGLRRICKEYL